MTEVFSIKYLSAEKWINLTVKKIHLGKHNCLVLPYRTFKKPDLILKTCHWVIKVFHGLHSNNYLVLTELLNRVQKLKLENNKGL